MADLYYEDSLMPSAPNNSLEFAPDLAGPAPDGLSAALQARGSALR